ncbi:MULTISPECIES: hypothetical protein [unclassified Burkholderia]|uniref:hypothetical protein n=1 Tax=unclassified Burkholderia TaxID=2613784 RepID=UPI002AAF96E8|nr:MULTISPECIES: hypothetical protein [unclassified Burkholderia]
MRYAITITGRRIRAARPIVFPALTFQLRLAFRPTPAQRAFPGLSARERMLEASAIIASRKFADHVSDDRRDPAHPAFRGPCGHVRRVARPGP